jgi:alcohol dehydrogenase (cytochrome c)
MRVWRFLVLACAVAAATSVLLYGQDDKTNNEGALAVQRICGACHMPGAFDALRYDRNRWKEIVEDMLSRGAQGTDREIVMVIDYLAAQHGPAAVPPASSGEKPAGGKATDITTATTVAAGAQSPVRRDQSNTQVPFGRILNAEKDPGNWLTYHGTYASQSYSRLSQIAAANVKNLELEWAFQVRWLDGPFEARPIVADGVLYTVQGNDVVALDATSGRIFWIYRYTPSPAAKYFGVNRGVAILGDHVFIATGDNHVVAIDAKSGTLQWDTGPIAKTEAGYFLTLAPLAVKDKVIVGSGGGEKGIRGFLAAFDAETGKQVWRFNTVPGPGEPGHETWGGESWLHGGASIWLTGSYDPETNLTYWGVGNPGPDYNGDVRPGDNLYSCSVVALDADTGQLKWYYQFNPHDEFDWDAVQVPMLVDMPWQGAPRKLMLLAQRNGFFYVLDRTTGEFLLGKPFARQNWNIGFDPKTGRPIRDPKAESSYEGVLIYPGNQGATNWYSPSYSPRTGLYYLSAWENTSTIFAKRPIKYEEGVTYMAGANRTIVPRETGMGFRTPQGPNFRMEEENYSAVRALDPHTGERKWQFKMSEPTYAGVLSTAGDVVFSGGSEGHFFALDARTGALLWSKQLGGQIMMSPMTYAVEGKQYVAVNAGNYLFVFGLRE